MRRKRNFSHYRNLCNYLKKTLPIEQPISIRRLPTSSDTNGDCCFDGKKFYIRISNQLSEDAAIFATLHECSHCLSWFKYEDDDHGKGFGIAYSKVYNHFLNWVAT